MKTININLIDDQTKKSNESKIKLISEDNELDPKIKLASIAIVVSACIIFITSFGIWSISSIMLKKNGKELKDLKLSNEKISIELSNATVIHKNLQKEEKILKTKFLAKNTIKTSLLPWHKILTDISKAVPKNIRINEISKTTETRNIDQLDVITIKGVIPQGKSRNDSLKAISYFILNINDNAPPDSTLEKSAVRQFDFDKTADIYNFEIVSILKSKNKEQDNSKFPTKNQI